MRIQNIHSRCQYVHQNNS